MVMFDIYIWMLFCVVLIVDNRKVFGMCVFWRGEIEVVERDCC